MKLLSSGVKPKFKKMFLLVEVWLCTGGGNMQMPLAGFPNQPVQHGAKEIADTTASNMI